MAVRLTDDIKLRIVQANACYDRPTVVSKLIKEEFGVEVSLPLVMAYDPTKKQAKGLSNKWRVIFEATRKQFLEDIPAIGIANKAVRLRALDVLLDHATSRRNIAAVVQLVEQAAREAHDYYARKSVVDDGDGGKKLTIVGGLPE